MRTFLITAAAALALTTVTHAGIEVGAGDPAPHLTGKSWYNHDKTSLEDLRGKAVFLDVWRTWCGPCTAQIPHLNELHHEYKDRGLVVLGISDESKSLVTKHMDKHGMEFPIAIIDREEETNYGIRAFPTSMLIDPDGVIVWRGHPAAFEREFGTKRLEEMLQRTSAVPQLPSGFNRVNKYLAAGQLGKAWAEAGRSLESGESSELTDLQERVNSMADKQLERAATLLKERAFGKAMALYAQAETRFEGMPQADVAAAQLAVIEDTDGAAKDIAASEQLAKAVERWRNGQFDKALSALESIMDKFAGTESAREAEEMFFRHGA